MQVESSETNGMAESWDEDPWLDGVASDNADATEGVDDTHSPYGLDARMSGQTQTNSTEEPFAEHPPTHPVFAVHESVMTPTGLVQLSTEDEAPAHAVIRRTVYLDARPYLQHRMEYDDVLNLEEVDQRVLEITTRLEDAHSAARQTLITGGLDGLNWTLVGQGEPT